MNKTRLEIIACVLVGLLGVLGVACKKTSAPRTPEIGGAPAPRRGEVAILYGDVRRKAASPPRRFAAALPPPRELDRLGKDEGLPPRTHVVDLLAAGDKEMQTRLLASLRAGVRQGLKERDLVDTWGELLAYHDEPVFCSFVMREAVGKEAEPIRALFWDLAARCEGPTVAALFARPDAPGRALLDFAEEQHTKGRSMPRFSKAMAEAAERIIVDEKPLRARVTAFTLVATHDPQAVQLVLRLHGQTKDPARRKDLAVALVDVKGDAAAQAIAKTACSDPDHDTACDSVESHIVRLGPPPTKELAALATAASVDVAAAIENRKGPEVVAALERCAIRNPKTYNRRDCLEALAPRDRARATAVAHALVGDDDPNVAELAATLLHFPSTSALEARLRELGVVVAPPAAPADRPPLVARDYLLDGGQSLSFDTETDRFPNDHDSVLRRLALKAGPRFPKVLFEEIAPEDPDGEGPYTLVAYTGGQRLEVTANNLSDWYDVDAMLGFLNVIARDAKLDVRFASLTTGDQMAHVVALPELTIRALARDGLLVLASPEEGRENGQAAERAVLDQLRKGR